MFSIRNFLKKPWNPYLCGVGIGSLQIPLFFIQSSLGTSSATGNFLCSVIKILREQTFQTCFVLAKNWCQLGIVLGIVLGAFFSKKISGNKPLFFYPDWKDTINHRPKKKRWVYNFFGGFLMMFGARLADGCTSGNGVSGVALMSLGSLCVIASMFIFGSTFSLLLYRRK